MVILVVPGTNLQGRACSTKREYHVCIWNLWSKGSPQHEERGIEGKPEPSILTNQGNWVLQGKCHITIARLPCLCVYHKSCTDSWFEVNRSCPEHPEDWPCWACLLTPLNDCCLLLSQNPLSDKGKEPGSATSPEGMEQAHSPPVPSTQRPLHQPLCLGFFVCVIHPHFSGLILCTFLPGDPDILTVCQKLSASGSSPPLLAISPSLPSWFWLVQRI